jgi:hypothetical protein
MADKKQKLVLSIIEFLETSITDGSIKGDDKEGIEVASVYLNSEYDPCLTDYSSPMHRRSIRRRSLKYRAERETQHQACDSSIFIRRVSQDEG